MNPDAGAQKLAYRLWKTAFDARHKSDGLQRIIKLGQCRNNWNFNFVRVLPTNTTTLPSLFTTHHSESGANSLSEGGIRTRMLMSRVSSNCRQSNWEVTVGNCSNCRCQLTVCPHRQYGHLYQITARHPDYRGPPRGLNLYSISISRPPQKSLP